MAVTGLGTRKKRARLPLLAMLSGGMLLASLVMFALELVRFAQSRDRLQTDITVAGVPVTGLTQSQAVTTWENVYYQPLQLEYLNSPILMLPADVGFRINSQQMQEQLRSQVASGGNYWIDFWNYLWRRPSGSVEIPLVADYSEARLRTFLEDLATRYDQRAGQAGFDFNTYTFNSGSLGQKIDVKKSLDVVQEALFRPTGRKVRLVMETQGGRAADMETLKQALLSYLDKKGFNPNGPDTLASVGVIDLQNGQEMWINGDIAYSSMSTMKIAVMLNFMAKQRFALEAQDKWMLSGSMLCSHNVYSNFLIQLPGQGNTANAKLADGLKQVGETATKLGAKYTFINAPFWVGQKAFSINDNPPPVPNPKFDARPDTWSRTTPLDMATLLQGLYDCAEYGSGVAAILPDNLSQTKCKQMVELMSGNKINRLIELGVPDGTRVAHKNGWGGTPNYGANVSDAAIVYTPGGNYVLVAFMWEAKANQDGLPSSMIGWESIEGISQIVYNFFNPAVPLTTARTPINPIGAIGCVMPSAQDKIDFTNINNGRFDKNGRVVPDACYFWPSCNEYPVPDALKPTN